MTKHQTGGRRFERWGLRRWHERFVASAALLGWLAAGCGGSSGGVDAGSANVAEGGEAGGSATPGSSIAMEIDKVDVSNHHVQVDFRLFGSNGKTLDSRGFTINWTLAVLTPDAATGQAAYTSLITRPAQGVLGTTQQPAAETTGSYPIVAGGAARYVFSTALPDTADLGATFRVGAWAQQIVDGGTAPVANATADFVPNHQGPPLDLASTATAACNQCHDPLAAHGGARREVALCVTCHTPQLFDPDSEDTAQPGQMNPLDFPVLVHRIHQGRDLPTLVAAQQAGVIGAKYHVIGFRSSDNVYGETVANTGVDGGAAATLQGVGFPRDVRDCGACHQQVPGASNWQTVVSRSMCGSCHDATWFAATPPPPLHHAHAGGAMADDRACATCHPSSGAEFDLSVAGSHTVPSSSAQLRGLRLQILSATGAAGGNPMVVFQVTNGDGSPVTPLASLDVLAATVSGPTSAYRQQNIIRQDVRAVAQPNPDGTWTYQFPPRAANDPWLPGGPVIAPDARGTFAVGLEGRRQVTLAPGVLVEEADDNPVAYFSVDGSPLARYTNVVDLARCDRCHGELRAHGNLRRNPEYCVLCHAADATDWAQRPKGADRNTNVAATIDQIEERSIRLPALIHRIHTGDELVQTVPFVVYGFGGSANRFDDVRFPGNRADCTTCHVANGFLIEAIPVTAPPTTANESASVLHQGTPVHPATEASTPVIQSACLSCHDSPAAKAHASLETTGTGLEACQVCHGEQRDVSVRSVHLANQ